MDEMFYYQPAIIRFEEPEAFEEHDQKVVE